MRGWDFLGALGGFGDLEDGVLCGLLKSWEDGVFWCDLGDWEIKLGFSECYDSTKLTIKASKKIEYKQEEEET